MKYYFEVLQTDIDPETSPDLQELIRLEVNDEKEALALAKIHEKDFPADRFTIKFHEHDHRDAKPCKTTDLRAKLTNPAPTE